MPDKVAPHGVDYPIRHLRFGWYSFLAFATLGLVLETLHGFKIRAYLDLTNETRRLMWTLAHAHGTLLSLLNVLFALTLRLFPEVRVRHLKAVSNCLILATLLLPGGFLIAGFVTYGGDPGIGILVVPIGAVLLLIAICMLARGERDPGIPGSRNR
ncbi:MAG TPA: hypothetical protein VG273_19890 [Bryobacteraceae bacterium]|nr:hypothetical protein [Bryobacteraceae bacterium]